MRGRRFVVAVALVGSVLAACGRSSSPSASAPGRDAGVTVAAPVAPPAIVEPDGAEALWEAFRAAHEGATTATVVETGQRLDALLTDAARQLLAGAAETSAQALAGSVKVSPAQVRFKLLGEGAVVRRDRIVRSTLTDLAPEPERPGAPRRWKLTVRDPDGGRLELVAAQVGDAWRLDVAPDLLVAEAELFRAPAGEEAPEGVASADQVAARWRAVLDGGTGWDAWNLISAPNRARILQVVASVGGAGAGDAVRILEKTLVDRRNRGIRTTAAEVTPRGDDHADVEITYSDGKRDTFAAVRAGGAWWLEIPM
ncbi:MAG TPA: hypothetical protein VM734_29190 [Kofleriaceae bacterium]|nr:hypothetical protein [Kofleriaceae bacterium]